jgi:teichuronic acid exporter
LMAFIALLAKPIVVLLLTEKWMALIPMLQWMMFARVFLPMSAINMNVLNAVGRSDLFLKVDLSKLPITLLALVITIPIGVKAMIIGHVITAAISFAINAYLPGKLYGYGLGRQLKDMFPVLIATIGMVLIIVVILATIDDLALQLVLSGFLGLFAYLGICRMLKIEELNEFLELLLKLKVKVMGTQK